LPIPLLVEDTVETGQTTARFVRIQVAVGADAAAHEAARADAHIADLLEGKTVFDEDRPRPHRQLRPRRLDALSVAHRRDRCGLPFRRFPVVPRFRRSMRWGRSRARSIV
jgi:hypothetical protein